MRNKKIKQQKYILFQIHTNDKIINMEVDKSKYDHFQTLSPTQQKCVQDMMTIKLLHENN
jgi:hypothetical protein